MSLYIPDMSRTVVHFGGNGEYFVTIEFSLLEFDFARRNPHDALYPTSTCRQGPSRNLNCVCSI
jgi:hypothetical protein